MDTLEWEDVLLVDVAICFLTHMLQLGILVIPTCPHMGYTIQLQMIHAFLHHHTDLHQTT